MFKTYKKQTLYTCSTSQAHYQATHMEAIKFHLLKSKHCIGDNQNAYSSLKCYNMNIVVQKMVLLHLYY